MSEIRAKPAEPPAPRQPVNWDNVRRRVDQLRVAIEHGWVPGPAESAHILHQRAEALATPLIVEARATEEIEVIEFCLGEERYGIESSVVREVFPLNELVIVPCTPSFVLGIINIRGEIVSVVDLKKLFELPERGITDLKRVLLLEGKGMLFGILVDQLFGVRTLAIDAIQNSLPVFGGRRTDYLRGITKDRLVVLDGNKLVADPDIKVYETVERLIPQPKISGTSA
jgi:purine-binding chemotaxis protein CheW